MQGISTFLTLCIVVVVLGVFNHYSGGMVKGWGREGVNIFVDLIRSLFEGLTAPGMGTAIVVLIVIIWTFQKITGFGPKGGGGGARH